MGEKTDRLINQQLVFQGNTSAGSLTADLGEYLENLNVIQNAAHTVRLFSYCSDASGGYVQFKPEYQYIPVLIGSQNHVTPLYDFVEILDEIVDYDSVIGELPHLSYSQVGGALSFLRKLAQLNPRNVDIDALEDAAIAEDTVFMEELKNALADKETSLVLNRD